MAERGIGVDHTTIHRWTARYAPLLRERFNDASVALPENGMSTLTYIKVRGQWMYLYRAIDSVGDTVKFWFSEQRDLPSAKCFIRKALQRHGRPDRVVIDGSQTNHEAIVSCDATNRLQDRSRRRLKPIGPSAHQVPRPANAWLQITGTSRDHPRRDRDGPHDAQAAGEVRLQSESVPGRAVRNSCRIICLRPSLFAF